MSNGESEQQIEDDPRIAKIYRHMRLVVGISLLVMAIGFLLVVGVIIYRLANKAPADAVAPVTHLDLPANARLVSLTAEGGRLFLAVEARGVTRVHVLDAAKLKLVGTVDFGPPAPPATVPLARPDAGTRPPMP